jgi:hypothetical protein
MALSKGLFRHEVSGSTIGSKNDDLHHVLPFVAALLSWLVSPSVRFEDAHILER